MSDVLELMYEFSSQQHGGNYRLMGFYLTPTQLDEIKSEVQGDSLQENSCGTFRGIAVYNLSQCSPPPNTKIDTLQGITFTYALFDPTLGHQIDLSLFDYRKQFRIK